MPVLYIENIKKKILGKLDGIDKNAEVSGLSAYDRNE